MALLNAQGQAINPQTGRPAGEVAFESMEREVMACRTMAKEARAQAQGLANLLCALALRNGGRLVVKVAEQEAAGGAQVSIRQAEDGRVDVEARKRPDEEANSKPVASIVPDPCKGGEGRIGGDCESQQPCEVGRGIGFGEREGNQGAPQGEPTA